MDEESFLRAIAAEPRDPLVRLVYADWLEERGDPRHEFVRLQVRSWGRESDEASRAADLAREQELRADCPHYWLARLDPPVWCAVGNVVAERQVLATGVTMRGSRLFRPNAKIYLASLRHTYALLDSERWRGESIEVVGQHRASREWIGCYLRAHATTNWRVRLVRHPGALIRLRRADWPGFRLAAEAFECPPEPGVENLRALFDAIISAREPRA